jgi:hypothetical protein
MQCSNLPDIIAGLMIGVIMMICIPVLLVFIIIKSQKNK